MKHTFSIVCSHICARGPRFFSCPTNTPSMPASFLFFSVAMPLYSSSVKWNTSEELSALIWVNLEHLGFVRFSARPLTSSWCATWLAVTRQGALELFGR